MAVLELVPSAGVALPWWYHGGHHHIHGTPSPCISRAERKQRSPHALRTKPACPPACPPNVAAPRVRDARCEEVQHLQISQRSQEAHACGSVGQFLLSRFWVRSQALPGSPHTACGRQRAGQGELLSSRTAK